MLFILELTFVLSAVGPALRGKTWGVIASSVGGVVSAGYVATFSLRDAAFSIALAVVVGLAYFAVRWLHRVGAIHPYVEKVVGGVVVPYVDADERAH
jgi:hypothetical protein